MGKSNGSDAESAWTEVTGTVVRFYAEFEIETDYKDNRHYVMEIRRTFNTGGKAGGDTEIVMRAEPPEPAYVEELNLVGDALFPYIQKAWADLFPKEMGTFQDDGF